MNHLLHGAPHPSEKDEYANCPICGSGNYEYDYEEIAYSFRTDKVIVWRCPDCEGLFCLDDITDPEDKEVFNS